MKGLRLGGFGAVAGVPCPAGSIAVLCRLIIDRRLRRIGTRLSFGMLDAPFFGGVDGGLMKPEIMIGELRVSLGGDPFTSRGRIMRQREIFLVQLLRVAAEFHIRAVRFIGSVSVRHIGLRTAITTASASAPTLCVLRLSHRPVYQLV